MVLEIGIVVAGVVIGFQVSLRGQQQAERAREAGYLTRLELELTAVVDELDQAREEVNAYFVRIKTSWPGSPGNKHAQN